VIVGEGTQYGHEVWLVDVTHEDGWLEQSSKFYKSKDKMMSQTPILAIAWSKIVDTDCTSIEDTSRGAELYPHIDDLSLTQYDDSRGGTTVVIALVVMSAVMWTLIKVMN
jgi:hypothetical protein